MALAGLWENWQSPAGEWVRSFALPPAESPMRTMERRCVPLPILNSLVRAFLIRTHETEYPATSAAHNQSRGHKRLGWFSAA